MKQTILTLISVLSMPTLFFKRFTLFSYFVLFKVEAHERAEVLIKKLTVQYQRSATENVLITHKLSTPDFLKLIGKPGNLIVSLYEHNSVEERIRNPTGRVYPGLIFSFLFLKCKCFTKSSCKVYLLC